MSGTCKTGAAAHRARAVGNKGYKPESVQSLSPLVRLTSDSWLSVRRVYEEKHELQSPGDVAFFAVLVDIEPLALDFRSDPQTNKHFYDGTDDRRCHNREQNCNCDCL